ncbi:MAG TPA: LCP family protein, partial [Acidimicrobiales bacterium]|nr:LCP family protein [Acidimicrobiales bacterium]
PPLARPSPPARAAGAPGGRRSAPKVPRAVVLRQRRRRRRTIIGTTIFLVVFNLVVGGTYAYFQWRLDQINRVHVPGLDEDVPGQVMNVLLVGSDSRERLTGPAAAQAGKEEVGGERSDTIMVLHVDPAQRKAAILSIPRDLYVPIAGTDRSDRVNTAFAVGGPEGLISTLVALGIQVNHYAEVDFVGFREIVDAVGGVTVFSPAPARDARSGLEIPRAGCVELDGTQALAYVRSREYETLVDGRWIADPRGDLGRIERQQDFVRRVMREAVSTGISSPITLNRLIGIGVKNLTVDATMSTSDITHVARRFRSVDPDSVETLVLPTAPQTIDGKDVLVLEVDDAQDEIAKINGQAPISPPTTQAPSPNVGTTAPGPPSPSTTRPLTLADFRVQVLNGTDRKGAAAAVAQDMKAVGVNVVGVGDARPAVYPRTVIRHAPGQEAKARSLQNGLKAGAEVTRDSTLRSADLVLVLGTDFVGFINPAAAPPTTVAPDPAPRSC